AARALHWYSDAATHRHPWVEVFGLGVAAARAAGRPSDEVALLNFTGWALYLCAERYDEARKVLEEALALAARIGDRREQAWATVYLASIALRTGDVVHSTGLARQAVDIFATLEFAPGSESALNVLGAGLSTLGRATEALEIHRQVLLSYQRRRARGAASTEVGEAMTTIRAARDLASVGRLAEAEATFTAAQELSRRCGI